MIELPYIDEFTVHQVADAGVPNKERVLIRAHVSSNLQGFVLGVGLLGQLETGEWYVVPIKDHVFHFAEQIVQSNSWVVIYTGKGAPQTTRLPTTLETAYSLHWGKPTVIFTAPNIVPILYRLSGIYYPAPEQQSFPQLLPSAHQRSLTAPSENK